MSHETPPKGPERKIEERIDSSTVEVVAKAIPEKSEEEKKTDNAAIEKIAADLAKKANEGDHSHGEEKKTVFAKALGYGVVWYPLSSFTGIFAGMINWAVKGFNYTLEKLGAKTSTGGGGHKKDDSHGGGHGHGGGGGHH